MSLIEEKRRLLEQLVETQRALEARLETQDQMIKRFRLLTENESLFGQIMDYFPYPLLVVAPSGVVEVYNRALLAILEARERVPEQSLNILTQCGDGQLARAFQGALVGETVFLYDLAAPLTVLGLLESENRLTVMDAVFFPITEKDVISHAVAVFLPQADLQGVREL